MKSYFTPNEIRLVGKAWEIRQQLRLLLSTAQSPEATMQQTLAAFATFRRFPSGAKRSKRIVLRSRRPEKKPDLRLVPFPS